MLFENIVNLRKSVILYKRIAHNEVIEGVIYTKNPNQPETVPIPQKLLLTVEEAAEYSNIGINKLYKLLNNPICPFRIHIGDKKRLIKRKQFEEYISKNIEI